MIERRVLFARKDESAATRKQSRRAARVEGIKYRTAIIEIVRSAPFLKRVILTGDANRGSRRNTIIVGAQRIKRVND